MVAELLSVLNDCAPFFPDHSVLSKRSARQFFERLLRLPELLPVPELDFFEPEPLLVPELDFFEPELLSLLLSLMTMRVVEPEEAAALCARSSSSRRRR